MHATIAAWDGDRLTLWDKTQWVHNTADEIAAVFGIPPENVRVMSPFVGGAFGSGLRTLAARHAGGTRRPRYKTAGEGRCSQGARCTTASAFGRTRFSASRSVPRATVASTAIVHDGYQETSTYEEFTEALLNPTASCIHARTSIRAIAWRP